LFSLRAERTRFPDPGRLKALLEDAA